jgi:alpha-D-xyloside xylohydrolase
MIGSDLLAVPVTADRAEADGAAGQPTPVQVYLPRGRWIDLYTGQVHAGGQTIVRESTLDEFPLYLRAGAAFGFNQRIDGVWKEPWNLNDLDRKDRTGWIYAPAPGRTRATNPFGGTLVAEVRGGRTELRLRGAPAETQVLLTTEATPTRVLVDGKPVRGVAGPAELRDVRAGWTRTPGPFGGLLLKLSPRHGHSSVVITTR